MAVCIKLYYIFYVNLCINKKAKTSVNYLAHMYLAGDDADSVIGNFIADHVKGEDILNYSSAIVAGIKMHRAVDLFTDTHPIVKLSISRLRPKFRKYSGVIVDMFYDHFLSAEWDNYSKIDIDTFTGQRFGILMSNSEIMPYRAQYLLPFMIKHNWMKMYGSIEGLNRALTGMSKRTSFASQLEIASTELEKYYEKFKGEFEEFFPQVVEYIKQEFPKIHRER